MAHDHEGHGHGRPHGAGGNERRVFWALLLTGGFLLAEAAGAVISGSLALLADAGHMLADTAALGLSWYAFRTIRSKPAHPRHSYGHHRLEVLAAFVNGSALIGIAVWISIEAVRRFFDPGHVLGGVMMAVAAAGLAVNVASFLILHGGDRENLNIRGAALHVLGDLLGSAAAMAAAGVILWTGWTPIDPILSVLVAALILRSAWLLASRSWHVLMEGAPEGLDVEEMKRELVGSVPDVLDVHHVHLWSLTPERPLITLHARIAARADHETVLHGLQRVLRERFDLNHATIQIEAGLCADAAPPGNIRAGSVMGRSGPSPAAPASRRSGGSARRLLLF